MKQLLDWVEHRTGIGSLMRAALYENIPGGARWRYVWGSTLVVAFFTQVVTGLVLWMSYSPSTQTAWESVYYIQYEMPCGWLLRGVHHYSAHAMVVLLALHLAQVVIDGAYRAPREFNFWIGLVLMLIVLGMSLTGYLLPWDQKGYWATTVATNLMNQAPGGGALRKLVIGGADYGHHTLTRFFAMHAGVLPALLVCFLVLHVALFRRHGLTARNPARRPDAKFWPDQVLRDAVACLAVLAVVLGLTLWMGSDLGAPADPASNYAAARPEWYFLFLFQFLKYFPGKSETIGAIVVPGLVMLVLFLMPLWGRWRVGHALNVSFLIVLLCAIGWLTFRATSDDYYAQWYGEDESTPAGVEATPSTHSDRLAKSREFLAAKHEAQLASDRAVELAGSPRKIPPTGALAMLRDDTKTQGRALFRQHCAVCHAFKDATGKDSSRDVHSNDVSASNLYGFASRQWIAGLLDPARVDSDHYFGLTAFKDGDMVDWVKENIGEVADEDRAAITADVQKVAAAVSAEAVLPSQADLEQHDAEKIAAGRKLITEDFSCIDCHKFHDDGELGMAPDLTGYGSRDWLVEFISSPEHERFYPDTNDRMPKFADPDRPDQHRLTAGQIEMIADWLRGDWYRPPDGKADTGSTEE